MPQAAIRMITRSEIEHALTRIDAVEVVECILREKHLQRAVLPAESTLYWKTANGLTARSIGMPGALPNWEAYGMKVINSSLANPDRGLARASGLVLMFHPETAQVTAVMDAARLSAFRTAAMSLTGALRLLGDGPIRLGLIGCGPIGQTHLELFVSNLDIEAVLLNDASPDRAKAAEEALKRFGYQGSITTTDTVAQLIDAASCVVTATTVTSPYITGADMQPGQTFINVSLDDLDDEAFLRADSVWVDDVSLVIEDHRRRLGRLLRSGAPVRLAGEVGRLVGDGALGRNSPDEILIFNPFGMSILDVGLAHALLPHLPTGGIFNADA